MTIRAGDDGEKGRQDKKCEAGNISIQSNHDAARVSKANISIGFVGRDYCSLVVHSSCPPESFY